MKISQETKKQSVDYMCEQIEYIIKEFGDRDPGAPGEIKALDHMEKELKGSADIIKQDRFKVAPHAFMGWVYFTGAFLILGSILFFFMPLLSLFCLVFAFLPLIGEFVFYRKTIDFLFKKRESGNLMAIQKPKGEVKRRIVLNGHSDAAYEWHWHKVGGFKMFKASLFLPAIGAILMAVFSIIALIQGKGFEMARGGSSLVFGIIGLIYIPFYIAFFWFSDNKHPVPGANDNLTACLMSMAPLQILKKEGIQLENTELCCLVTGSEEAGLRGAKVWAENNKDFVNEVETIFLTFETLRELEHLVIYNKDMNGLTANCKEVSTLFKKAAKKEGLDLKFGSVYCGATDAAAFSQAGFKASAVAAMSPQLKDYYHTRKDNFDNLDKPCLSKVLDITMEMIDDYDKNGL